MRVLDVGGKTRPNSSDAERFHIFDGHCGFYGYSQFSHALGPCSIRASSVFFIEVSLTYKANIFNTS